MTNENRRRAATGIALSAIGVAVLLLAGQSLPLFAGDNPPTDTKAFGATTPQKTEKSDSSEAVAAKPDSDRPKSIMLFNGKDLSGWAFDLAKPDVKMEDVWSVKDGVLHCKGQPNGYIITKRRDFKDYKLTFDWRWPTGKGGNSGLLLHCSTPRERNIWCKSIEVQLMSGNAGDFIAIGTELKVENEKERKDDRRYINLTDDSEKKPGEWNRMVVVCRGNEIIVKINGDLVNHATNTNVAEGAISLQSEGTPVEFRNVKLTPLPKRK